jgi:hypothetical protein
MEPQDNSLFGNQSEDSFYTGKSIKKFYKFDKVIGE